MNSLKTARRAYSQERLTSNDPRNLEFEVFLEVTKNLKSSYDESGKVNSRLATSIFANLKLWREIALQAASSKNEQDITLRERLIYLHDFIRRESSKVLSGDRSVDALIEINIAVMRGLKPSRSKK